MTIGSLALRAVVGPLFIGHGTQKLFGWFGGHGPEGTGGFFETLGLRPGRQQAMAAGAAETLGGTLVTLGAYTPVGATMISGTMVTAIRKAHLKQGPWVTQGGYEYCLTVIGAMTALTDWGPGKPSVDAVRRPRFRGGAAALLHLAAAVAGSYAVDIVSHMAEQRRAAGPQLREHGQTAADPASGRRFTRTETAPAAPGEQGGAPVTHDGPAGAPDQHAGTPAS